MKKLNVMLGSWEIAHIDSAHRKLSETGPRCAGSILEGGALFAELQLQQRQAAVTKLLLLEIKSCEHPGWQGTGVRVNARLTDMN